MFKVHNMHGELYRSNAERLFPAESQPVGIRESDPLCPYGVPCRKYKELQVVHLWYDL